MNKEKAKLNIKRNLWRWGFRCKDVSDVTGYDLIVTDPTDPDYPAVKRKKFRVKVKIGRTDIEAVTGVHESGCDVIAIVTGKKKRPRLYAIGGDEKENGSRVFDEWKETPLGVFRDAKREPSD